MIEVSAEWKAAYPEAHAGFLAMRGVSNPPAHAGLEARKQALENEIRQRFAGLDRQDIAALPVMAAYEAYYKPFKKTYHVQLQLESIAFKGKSLPSVAALVEAMFMAEVKNLLLTAGHDLDSLHLPVTVGAAAGSEQYTLMRGTPQTLKPGDMYMADGQGVISSILYGPDQRTQITPATQNVLFAVYAPAGIPSPTIEQHLQDIRDNVLLVSPRAVVEELRVVGNGE